MAQDSKEGTANFGRDSVADNAAGDAQGGTAPNGERTVHVDKGRTVLTALVVVVSLLFLSAIFYFSTTSNSKIDELQKQLMVEQQKREQYSKQLQTVKTLNLDLKSRQAIAQEEERVKNVKEQMLASQLAVAQLELQKIKESAAIDAATANADATSQNFASAQTNDAIAQADAQSAAQAQAAAQSAAQAQVAAQSAAQAQAAAQADAARQAAIQAQLQQQRQTTRAS